MNGPQLIDLGSPVDTSAPVNRGLVAWYYGLPNNSGGTRWFDLLGRYELTLTNTPAWRPQGVSLGNYLRFTASSSQHASNTAFSLPMPMTMSAWFNAASVPASGGYGICTSINAAVTNYCSLQLRSATDSTRVWALTRTPGPTFVNAATSAAYSTNTWQHACGIFTSSTSRAVYLNGGNKGTNTTSNSPTGMDNVFVGSVATVASPFDGSIACVRLFNITLDDARVREEYTEGLLGWQTAFKRYVPKAWTFSPVASSPPPPAAYGIVVGSPIVGSPMVVGSPVVGGIVRSGL